MTDTKRFHIGCVLSVTSGRLLSKQGIDGVYEILSWMARGPVWSHQIPSIRPAAAAVILDRFPQLAGADVDGVNPDNLGARLSEWELLFGETMIIPKMTEEQYSRSNPVADLERMVGPGKTIIVFAKENTP